MVPRYERMPLGATAFDTFLLGRLEAEGKVTVDTQRVLAITQAYRISARTVSSDRPVCSMS
jgi:hypothetical protein